jgi:hypothetical protein
VAPEKTVDARVAEVRRMFAEHEAGKRTLPLLLVEVRDLIAALPAPERPWRDELAAALAGVARAWGDRQLGGPSITLTLDAEHSLHDAMAELRRVLDRRPAPRGG